MPQSMGLQQVGPNLVTEQQQQQHSALELWFSLLVSDPAILAGKPFHKWDQGLYQGSYKACLSMSPNRQT